MFSNDFSELIFGYVEHAPSLCRCSSQGYSSYCTSKASTYHVSAYASGQKMEIFSIFRLSPQARAGYSLFVHVFGDFVGTILKSTVAVEGSIQKLAAETTYLVSGCMRAHRRKSGRNRQHL